jgi:hypothetical protein
MHHLALVERPALGQKGLFFRPFFSLMFILAGPSQAAIAPKLVEYDVAQSPVPSAMGAREPTLSGELFFFSLHSRPQVQVSLTL